MPFKPNYRLDRAERTRSKDARKQEKQAARAARRKSDTADDPLLNAQSAEPNEDQDGTERTIEE